MGCERCHHPSSEHIQRLVVRAVLHEMAPQKRLQESGLDMSLRDEYGLVCRTDQIFATDAGLGYATQSGKWRVLL